MHSVGHVPQQLGAGESELSLPQALCDACADALCVTGVTLTLLNAQGSMNLVAGSDHVSATVEALHFETGEGPYLDCGQRAGAVLQPGLRQSGPARWPGFAPAALQAGVEAVFAFPAPTGGSWLGVLGLTRDTPGPLSRSDVVHAQVFAQAAAHIVLGLQDLVSYGHGLHPDLTAVHHDRAQVHQATGVISVQATVDVDQALSLLRARAFCEGRTMTAIAHDVLTRKTTFQA